MSIPRFKNFLGRFSRFFLSFLRAYLFGTCLRLDLFGVLILSDHLVLCYTFGVLCGYHWLTSWKCHIHEGELSSVLSAHPLGLTIDRHLVHQILLNGLSGLIGHWLLIPESLPQPVLLRLTPSYHLVKVLHQSLLHGIPSSPYYPIKVLLAHFSPWPWLLSWIPYAHDFLLKAIQKAQLLLKLVDLL